MIAYNMCFSTLLTSVSPAALSEAVSLSMLSASTVAPSGSSSFPTSSNATSCTSGSSSTSRNSFATASWIHQPESVFVSKLGTNPFHKPLTLKDEDGSYVLEKHLVKLCVSSAV